MEQEHGTRDHLVSTLREMSTGWWHFGKDKLSADASDGAQRLASGAESVRVGHTVYTVTE